MIGREEVEDVEEFVIIIIIIIIIHNILRGGLQSPRGGFQEGPLRK